MEELQSLLPSSCNGAMELFFYLFIAHNICVIYLIGRLYGQVAELKAELNGSTTSSQRRVERNASPLGTYTKTYPTSDSTSHRNGILL
ncbi:unnamed protein product, partial [Mesorhabditis spiculigera]